MIHNKLIGHGAYSRVYAEGGMAIKVVLNKDYDSAIREIILLARCKHDNIVKLVAVQNTPADVRMHMKLYDMNLVELIQRDKNLHIEVIYGITDNIIAAVNYLHNNGITHADLKPQNILLDLSAVIPVAVVCDLGLSSVHGEKYHTGRVQTITYRAPEVCGKHRRVRYRPVIDMWSVGIIMYEMILGKSALDQSLSFHDSSDYAWNLFKLAHMPNFTRTMRLNLLDNIDSVMVKTVINNNIIRTDISAAYINIIAGCIIPNFTNRMTAAVAVLKMRAVMTEANIKTLDCIISEPQQAIPLTYRVDPSSPLSDVPVEILNMCKTPLWLLFAENIYDIIPNNVSHIDKCYIALYIYGCIFSGSLELVESIEFKIGKNKIRPLIKSVLTSVTNYIMETEIN